MEVVQENRNKEKLTASANRAIRKVAVLGSGVMGSGIAAHFANIGLEVLMLDMPAPGTGPSDNGNKASRNAIADKALKAALKTKPAPFYLAKHAGRITTGNFEDDFSRIGDCDWVIEVVVERLDIKQQVFEQVDLHRKPGSLVTSNTSGIPIHLMTAGRSEDFTRHFCGTHFFNPPRYLRLLEVIPTPGTDPAVVEFLMAFGDRYLGKETVLCKDTPAFIANRVGVYAMSKIYQLTSELGLGVEVVDKLTGPAIGRPRTGTFRLGDLVGHDTAVKVMKGIAGNCPDDEQASVFEVPDYLQFMLDNNYLGNKTGKGFYHRTKDETGQRVILSLDLKTLEYRKPDKTRLDSLEKAKNTEDLTEKVRAIIRTEDAGGQLVKRSLGSLFAYVSNRVPEISDNLYAIDDALRAGFAWEAGPFEYWDMVGLEEGIRLAEEEGLEVAEWVRSMAAGGKTTFYSTEQGSRKYFDLQSGTYMDIPGSGSIIILDRFRAAQPVWQNSGAVLHDIGDGILNLEFRSKMNTIGGEVIEGINKSIQIAEKDFRGLVIGNEAPNFSVGANLMMIHMMAIEQEYEELDLAIRQFQRTMMRARYSSVPVVAAPHGMTMGGGCELTMHADAAVAAAETYIGLVEVGVGLIPAGGGTKESALRASDGFGKGEVQIPSLQEKFLSIAMAKVSTSADEAFELGHLDKNRDRVVINRRRLIDEAKQTAVRLAEQGYSQPASRSDILVLGRTGLGTLTVGIESFKMAGYISGHDAKIARKLAYVLCGGDLSSPTRVSEQYLLDLEREAFLSLCGERNTLERIQHMLQTGKPLRN